jgi:parafibromin
MATTTDEESIKEALLQWSSENALSEATLSEDGQILTLQETSLANRTLSVEFGGKSCQYTLASIYLQILDPGQGLLAYRNACKKHNVSDPVKALDKPTVVGYFVGASSAPAAAAAAVPPPAEAAVAAADDAEAEAGEAAEDKSKDRKKSSKHESSKRKDKEHKSKRKESSGSSSKHRGDRDEKSPKKKKPKSALVTNEQLFSNLKDVVDKRQSHHETETEEEITKALSTQGFDVTPELLQEHKETTHTILANEIPVGDSSSILRAANPRKDLSRVLEIFLETVAPPKSSSSSSKPSKPTSSSRSSSTAPQPPRKPTKSYLIGKKPVIVVPKGMTAPITLMNAHGLFCDSHFEPRDVLMKQGRHRNPPTTFTRNVRLPGMSGTSLVEYEIVDNPKKLGDPREWERIVAVIVLGQSWQFKDWPNPYNNPVHLFSRTLGFHISLEGDKVPPESMAWAIERGTLSREKRGLDSVTYAKFWNGLDHFMSVHKRELLPQAQS